MPRCSKSTEMIEANDVNVRQHRTRPIDPPAISACPKRAPVVDRIAPSLSLRAEVVGRHTRDDARPVLGIEKKEVRVRPHIARIRRDEKREIPDQSDVPDARMRLQPRALP